MLLRVYPELGHSLVLLRVHVLARLPRLDFFGSCAFDVLARLPLTSSLAHSRFCALTSTCFRGHLRIWRACAATSKQFTCIFTSLRAYLDLFYRALAHFQSHSRLCAITSTDSTRHLRADAGGRLPRSIPFSNQRVSHLFHFLMMLLSNS